MFILNNKEKLSFLKIVYSFMMEDNIFTDKEKEILEEILCKEIFQLRNDTSDYQIRYTNISKLENLIQEIKNNEVHIFLFKIIDDIIDLNPSVKDELVQKSNKLKEFSNQLDDIIDLNPSVKDELVQKSNKLKEFSNQLKEFSKRQGYAK